MTRLPARMEVDPLGGTPQVTGEELILLLFLCIGCRPAPMRALGNKVSLPFRMEKITGLLQWMFPFSSLVLVIVSTEISLPGEHLSSKMLLSAQKPFGGLCPAGTSIGTLTEWKLPSPSWLELFLQRWLSLQRGAQKQISSRQILGQLWSSTENVGINSLRGSNSASPFSCGVPFGLGALPPLTRLEKQRQTSVKIVWSLHCKRVICSLLQSRQQRRLKRTVVLGCAAKPSAFKRIPTMVCPVHFPMVFCQVSLQEEGAKPAVVLRTRQV